jgi:hypothetical protein
LKLVRHPVDVLILVALTAVLVLAINIVIAILVGPSIAAQIVVFFVIFLLSCRRLPVCHILLQIPVVIVLLL